MLQLLNYFKMQQNLNRYSLMENYTKTTRKLLKPHPVYLALSAEPTDVNNKYQALFSDSLSDKVTSRFTQAALCSMPVGNTRFTEEIEKALGYSIGKIKSGRPATVEAD